MYRCISKIVALDGVKRSAADASITRSKYLAKRRSEKRNSSSPNFTPNNRNSSAATTDSGGEGDEERSHTHHRSSSYGRQNSDRSTPGSKNVKHRGFGTQDSRELRFVVGGESKSSPQDQSNSKSGLHDGASPNGAANGGGAGMGKLLGALRGARGFKNLVNASREVKGLDNPLDMKKSRHRTFYFD
jgi:hypothetical protein